MHDCITVTPLAALQSERDVIPVVSAIDANFVPVYSVFLSSLLEHSNSNKSYDLILLTENVPAEAIHALKIQIFPYPHVTLRSVDMSDFAAPFLDKVGFKRPAYFRLVMPKLLPEYARAVYLDSDIILLEDVAKLYYILESGFAAVVPDITMRAYCDNSTVTEDYLGSYGNINTYWTEHLALSSAARQTYFNSGVLVLDLEKMRNSNVCVKFEKLLHEKPFIFADQDILNIVFDGDVQEISLKWNFFQALNPKLKYSDSVLAKRTQAAKNICLIHYAWKKPWAHSSSVPYEEYFWFYARKSIYYEQLVAKKQHAVRSQYFFSRVRRKLELNPLMGSLKMRFPKVYIAIRDSLRMIRHG